MRIQLLTAAVVATDRRQADSVLDRLTQAQKPEAETQPAAVAPVPQKQVDVGAGILLGDIGLYVATPVRDVYRRGGVNFFIRLAPRF